MPARRPPVPLAHLTPDRLAGVHQVHAFDPFDPGFDAWLPVLPDPPAGDTARILEVAIDRGRLDAQLALLKAVVRAATGG
jgi:hypothetical protein